MSHFLCPELQGRGSQDDSLLFPWPPAGEGLCAQYSREAATRLAVGCLASQNRASGAHTLQVQGHQPYLVSSVLLARAMSPSLILALRIHFAVPPADTSLSALDPAQTEQRTKGHRSRPKTHTLADRGGGGAGGSCSLGSGR